MSPALIIDIAGHPRPSDPVFFMLRPTPDAAEQISRLAWRSRAEYRLKGKPLDEHRLHVSLHGVGAYGQLSRNAFAAIDCIASALTMPPFLVGFDRLLTFGITGNRPLVLCGDDGVAGVTMLQSELAASLRKVGFAAGKRDYTPHVTLLYDRKSIDRQFVEEIRWRVDEIVLACSLHGRSRHIPLARWNLRTDDTIQRHLPHCLTVQSALSCRQRIDGRNA
jgi:2'-5' RNA ligase